jgi:hypothetical protein
VQEVSGKRERALTGQVHGLLIMAHFAYRLARCANFLLPAYLYCTGFL